MTNRPAFRELGKIVERWQELAERRRDHFAELYQTGRWRLYYEEDAFRGQAREVASICDRWSSILERHQDLLKGPESLVEPAATAPEAAEAEAAVVNRDAA